MGPFMRIAVVPSWYNSPKAPSRGNFVHDQVLELKNRGHEVIVIVFDRDASYPLLNSIESIEDGIRHIRISVPYPWHRILGFYAPTLLAKKLVQILEVYRPHLVHAHAVRPAGVVTELAMRQYPLPWCITEHSGILTKFWLTRHGRSAIARAFFRCGALIAVSNFLRLELVRLFPGSAEHAEVIYNGIDCLRFSPKSFSPGAGRLLYVGSLVEEKGVNFLLEALSLLPKTLPWTLSLVGDGREFKALLQSAEELGIARHLYWHGSVPHRSMPKVFCAHDVLIVASIHETFSLVCAEALACGIPVVATKCGGPEEVVPDWGGKLVPVGSPEALSNGILSMLERAAPFDRDRSVEHIRHNFSMEQVVDRLEAVYGRLLKADF
jgi:glycosyltransferase involved in cell wall biosynthesis